MVAGSHKIRYEPAKKNRATAEVDGENIGKVAKLTVATMEAVANENVGATTAVAIERNPSTRPRANSSNDVG